MSLLFDATTEWLQQDAAPGVTDEPLTVSLWFYPTSLVNSVLFAIGLQAGTAGGWSITTRTTGVCRAVTTNTSSQVGTAESGNTASANTWNHVVTSYGSNTNRAVRLNGGTEVSETTNRVAPTPDRWRVGNQTNSAALAAGASYICEVAIWNVILSDAEKAALAARVDPRLIRPANLTRYVPVFGLGASEPILWRTGGLMTLGGSPTPSAHAPVQYPTFGGDDWMPYVIPAGGTAYFRTVTGSLPAQSGNLSRKYQAKRSPVGSLPAQSGAISRIYQAKRSPVGSLPAPTGVLTRANGVFHRAVAGSLPAQSGALSRIYQAKRSPVGSLPAQSGAISRIYQAKRNPVGSLPAQTGVVSRIYQAKRALDGSLPAQSGVLTRANGVFHRSVAGSLPAMTGALSRIYQAKRPLAGSLPAQSGALSRIYQAKRSLAGSLPGMYAGFKSIILNKNAGVRYAVFESVDQFYSAASVDDTGTVLQETVFVTVVARKNSSLPSRVGLLQWDTSIIPDTATITYASVIAFIANKADNNARSLTMDYYNWDPADAGDYTATEGTDAHAGTLLSDLTLASFEEFALLNPNTNINKSGFTQIRFHVSGPETSSDSITFSRHGSNSSAPTWEAPKLYVEYTTNNAYFRSLAGSLPSPTGILTRLYKAKRSLAGSLPAQSGALTRHGVFHRALAGSLPAMSGVLTRIYQAKRAVAGSLPAQSGLLSRVKRAVRALAGSLPAQSGALTRRGVFRRTPTGSLPAPTGVLTRASGVFRRALAGNLPAPTGVLSVFRLAIFDRVMAPVRRFLVQAVWRPLTVRVSRRTLRVSAPERSFRVQVSGRAQGASLSQLSTSPASREQAASETLGWAFDFSRYLTEEGQTVNGAGAPDASIYDLTNENEDVSAVCLNGSPAVDGDDVIQSVTALTAGHNYRLDVRIRPVGSDVRTASMILRCVQ